MVGFGYKTGWLAVRDGELDGIVRALGGRVDGPVGWVEGVRVAYDRDDTVLVTPRLPGADGAAWMLVAGWYVAHHRDTLDVAALSATLDREVQLFVTHRVVELHRWERAAGGVRVRAFEYIGESGEVRRWHGPSHDVELAIGLPPEPPPDESVLVGEEDVMRVAGAWSVDPTALDGQPAPGPLRLVRFPAEHDHPDGHGN